jgi:type VI secretion system protein ImpC
LLGSLGTIAARSGGPFLASAAPGLLGYNAWTDDLQTTGKETRSETDPWQALRSHPVAPWIGLVAPRFLLRLPYGAAHDPIDAFPFEEIEDKQNQHDEFLWGSASLLCAALIATSYLENQWDLTLGDHLEIDDLPAFTFAVDGQMQLQPCAQAYLSERLADLFLTRGVMPLMSFKNRNAVRLWRFQSIAKPASPLAGPWS